MRAKLSIPFPKESQASGVRHKMKKLAAGCFVLLINVAVYADDSGCRPYPDVCTTEQEVHRCLITRSLVDKPCTASLHVTVVPQPDQVKNIAFRLQDYTPPTIVDDFQYAFDWFDVDLVTGAVKHAWKNSPRLAAVTSLSETLQAYDASVWASVQLQPWTADHWNTAIADLWAIDVNLVEESGRPHLRLTFNANVKHRNPRGTLPTVWTFPFAITVPQPPIVHDEWTNNCSAEQQACTPGLTECLESNTTHTISGVAVTRACWQQTLHKKCPKISDNCRAWSKQGCTLDKQSCLTQEGDICWSRQQSWQCPVEHCTRQEGLICPETQPQPTPEISLSFSSTPPAEHHQAAQHLVVMPPPKAEKMKVSFLAGRVAECRAIPEGRHPTRWRCQTQTSKEKRLAQERERKLAVSLGHYCRQHQFPQHGFGCAEYRRVFCVFKSPLARVIQTQGRAQLGLGFGSVGGDTAKPDCSGFSGEQFQRLLFKSMDFKEIEAAMHRQTPQLDRNALHEKLLHDIQRLAGDGL